MFFLGVDKLPGPVEVADRWTFIPSVVSRESLRKSKGSLRVSLKVSLNFVMLRQR